MKYDSQKNILQNLMICVSSCVYRYKYLYVSRYYICNMHVNISCILYSISLTKDVFGQLPVHTTASASYLLGIVKGHVKSQAHYFTQKDVFVEPRSHHLNEKFETHSTYPIWLEFKVPSMHLHLQ